MVEQPLSPKPDPVNTDDTLPEPNVTVSTPPPEPVKQEEDDDYSIEDFRAAGIAAGKDFINAVKRPYKRLARGIETGIFGAIKAFSENVDPNPPKDKQ